MHFIYPNQSLKQTKAKAASLATPAVAGDGLSVSTWNNGGGGYPKAYVALTADGAATLTNAALYGLEPVTGIYCFISYLNNQQSISLTATLGYVEQFDLPTAFSELAVGGTVSASNVGYTMVPIKESY